MEAGPCETKEKHGEGGGTEAKNWAWYFRRIVIRSKIWGCFEVLRNEKDVGIQLYGLKMRARLELQVCEYPMEVLEAVRVCMWRAQRRQQEIQK